MGVEYRHFLVVGEPTWLPQADTLTRVDAVLRSWSLVTAAPEVFDLAAGGQRPLPEIPTSSPGPGVALVYPTVEGAAAASIFGPSYYPEVVESDRYIQSIVVVAGLDFRVHWGSEGICFTVKEPPREAGRDVEAHPDAQRLYLYSESYPATALTSPPVVAVEVEAIAEANIAFSGYSGVWRAAVVLDCGKDLPGFVDGLHSLPSRSFIAAVSEAIRSPLHEIGEVY